ncbi:hypothetical protein L9F63_005213, partial [Diploptera punctata]
MSLFKSYKPECVPEKIKAVNIQIAFANVGKLNPLFEQARNRLTGTQVVTKNKLVWDVDTAFKKVRNVIQVPLVPSVDYVHFESQKYRAYCLRSILEFTTTVSVGSHLTEVDLPCSALSLLQNEAGLHVIAFGGESLQTRLSYKLYHTLHKVFIDQEGDYTYKEKEKFLERVAELQDYMQQGVPVVSRFLAKYLYMWDCQDYRDQVLRLLQWISITSYKELYVLVLVHIRTMFLSGAVDVKCAVVATLNKLVHNLFSKNLFTGTHLRLRPANNTLNSLSPRQIQRSVGFENVRKSLRRWNAVVEAHRSSDHLKFPLTEPTIEFETTNGFVEKIKSQTRTPLEAQMDEILNESPAVQEEKKEIEYQLNLAENANTSHQMAQERNSIENVTKTVMKSSSARELRSMRYHRIERRERIRKQLREFEKLQKEDPEAALKQLELLERTRALERVSLRHRNTGQWARNKAVRAKYNKESRQELAQQLSISRDLTRKVKVGDSSDEEEGDDIDKQTEPTNVEKQTEPTNVGNLWAAKKSSEVEEFESGYRQFWDKQNKKLSQEINVTKQKNKNENIESEYVNNEINVTKQKNSENMTEEEETQQNRNKKKIAYNAKLKGNIEESMAEAISSKTPKQNKKLSPKNISSIVEIPSKIVKQKNKSSPKLNKNIRKTNNKTNETINSFSVSENTQQNSPVVATSDSWVVTQIEVEELDDSINNSEKDIGKILDNVESNIKKVVKTKLKRFSEMLNTEKTKTNEGEAISDDEGPSLKMKKTVSRIDLDEKLIEETSNVNNCNHSSDVNLKELVAQSKINKNDSLASSDIDLNTFTPGKPKLLNTDLPDVVTRGVEGIDDDEEE